MHFSAPTSGSDGFEPWEQATAKAEVNDFIATRGMLVGYDREDLQWMCLEHWWEKRAQYEPDLASRKTFMKRIIVHYLEDLWRKDRATKRRADRSALSLDAVRDPDGLPIAELLADDNLELQPDVAAERADAQQFVERFISTLSEPQRALIEGRLGEQSMSELSRLLRTPRATLYGELERIKRRFLANGLGDDAP